MTTKTDPTKVRTFTLPNHRMVTYRVIASSKGSELLCDGRHHYQADWSGVFWAGRCHCPQEDTTS